MGYRLNRSKVVLETFEDETILINMDSGVYFSLNRPGAQIVALLERGLDAKAVVTELERQFEAEPQVIASAVSTLIESMMTQGLIEECAAVPDTQPAPCPAPESRRPFEAPALELFDDMQDLLMLDPVHDVDATGWPQGRPGPVGPHRGESDPD